MARIRTQPGSPEAKGMEVVAIFAPSEPPDRADYAQVYAREVSEVRIDYSAGHVEIRAVVLESQTLQQVQAEILARVAAVEPVVVTATETDATSKEPSP